MPEHLFENTAEWILERMRIKKAVIEARKAMRDLDAVELDWFPVGPMAETKRLAIIIEQKEHCADTRLIEALEKQRGVKQCSALCWNTKRLISSSPGGTFISSH
jgi:hypothetical protein